jgi:tetratricopeptide (TPR) repeat protein
MHKKKRMLKYLIISVSLLTGFSGPAFSQDVSDEARRHFDRGMAAVEIVKAQEDYEVAMEEFKQAAMLAPEWPDAFYNLGLVQEKAGRLKDAADSLKIYLKLAPDATDADTVKSLINKLEFKAEQTLTIPDIIEALASGFDYENDIWKYTATGKTGDRECRRGRGELRLSREGVDTVKALKSDFLYQPVPYSYQTLKVTGPVLKYTTTINVCDDAAEKKRGGCSSIVENEIEVVSKRLIKINQKVIRGGYGAGVTDGDEFSCTFQQ